MRTADLATATGVERSEAYRITARLRVLGLFGIENDRSGTRGGRRYWRTSIEHDAPGLSATRHRDAWARITGWARAAATRARAVAATTQAGLPAGLRLASGSPMAGGEPSFAERFRAAGLGALMDEWGVT